MVRRRNLVHLRGYQVFEAVARRQSVTAAAEELGVTQSAVSHQLRALSTFLGEDLIERRGRTIALTDTGRRLAEGLSDAFDLIEQSAATVIGRGRRILRVAVYSSFASGWLIPALPDFRSRNPDIDLRLIMSVGDPELSDNLADAFITSNPIRRGYWSTSLCAERLVAVAHPSTVAGEGFPALPLISTEIDPLQAGVDWEGFFAANALEPGRVRRGDWICCSHFLLAMDMARAGMGAALVPDFLAVPAIARGELVRLSGKPVATGLNYDLAMKSERRTEPALAAFARWIVAAAKRAPGR